MSGKDISTTFLSIVVASIVGIGVTVPIITDSIQSMGLTGVTAIVLGIVPVLLAVLLIVAMAGPIMERTG